jgi:hypothetical protein
MDGSQRHARSDIRGATVSTSQGRNRRGVRNLTSHAPNPRPWPGSVVWVDNLGGSGTRPCALRSHAPPPRLPQIALPNVVPSGRVGPRPRKAHKFGHSAPSLEQSPRRRPLTGPMNRLLPHYLACGGKSQLASIGNIGCCSWNKNSSAS